MTRRRIDVDVRRASDLGPIIAQVREARGIRQVDLSDDLGFARSYLAKLESGRPVIQLSRLFQLLRRLGIRVTLSFDAPDPSHTKPVEESTPVEESARD